jgi:hypothetical protein
MGVPLQTIVGPCAPVSRALARASASWHNLVERLELPRHNSGTASIAVPDLIATIEHYLTGTQREALYLDQER